MSKNHKKRVNTKPSIIFLGSSDFSLPILDMLYKNFDLKCVVLKSREPTAVLLYARENNIKTILFDDLNDSELSNCDYIVVASFGKIIPKSMVLKYKFINVHASLLPDLRGATPIQTALYKGCKVTGVSIILMNDKLDEGDILSQDKINIDDGDNYKTLESKLSLLGANLLEKTLNDFKNITQEKQVHSKATYCYIDDFKREKGQIDWNLESIDVINKIRAFYPAWTYLSGVLCNIKEATLTDIESEEPGHILDDTKDLLVGCSDYYIKIDLIQKEGKQYITGKDFRNGMKTKRLMFVSF
ncbi:MAG: methionyl-tRNA formyltransferase [Patescibacteria group bacterium]